MKWIEVIKIRAAGTDFKFLKEILLPVGKLTQIGLSETVIYRNAVLESDWAIHLYWETASPEPNGSVLGLHLSRLVNDFGLIDHSVWINETKTLKS